VNLSTLQDLCLCMLFYAGTGIPAGTKSLPGIMDGEGRLPVVVHGDGDGDGENSPRGDGDGGLSSDGEVPFAIFNRTVASVWPFSRRNSAPAKAASTARVPSFIIF
jgi:hypothetical protein